MDMEVFARKVCAAVERELGEGFRTEVKEVRKNNSILLHGLLIMSKGQTVVPTIYLEHFLEAYESGLPFEEVVRKLLAVYWRDMPLEGMDMDFFKSFGNVRDRICYCLIGRKGNEEMLENIPHVEFLDLAVCFYYAYHGERMGDGIILIYNSHMEMWRSNIMELAALAERNTRRLFPWECRGMEEILEEMIGVGEAAGIENPMEMPCGIPLKVLTNNKRTRGAVCILYPGVLDKMAEEMGSDFFILPSSIHEVILIPDMGNEDSEALKN